MVETLSKEEEIQLQEQIKAARKASRKLANIKESDTNTALNLIERELLESVNYILEANKKDLAVADEEGMEAALKDRLTLSHDRLRAMAQGIRSIANLKEVRGQVIDGWLHPKGMRISQVRVPLGVIGIIYEARPNVTTDAVALAIKSGNGLVLRGSCHAWHSNNAIIDVVKRALEQTNLPQDAIQFLQCKSRDSAKLMLAAKDDIDLVIPRGGEGLNHFVMSNSLIPVLGAGGGNCHTYIDKDADLEKAIKVAVNAKTHRPSVCNSCESILVHEQIASKVLPPLLKELQSAGVEIVGDQTVQNLGQGIAAATDEDWATEYLDMKVSIKVVDSIDEAIEHINSNSTQHSEAIITESMEAALQFKQEIDSAAVYVNVSTRFTDGEEFGFGAEMGISTQKMHARGPIGLKELTTYKFIIEGEGQIK